MKIPALRYSNISKNYLTSFKGNDTISRNQNGHDSFELSTIKQQKSNGTSEVNRNSDGGIVARHADKTGLTEKVKKMFNDANELANQVFGASDGLYSTTFGKEESLYLKVTNLFNKVQSEKDIKLKEAKSLIRCGLRYLDKAEKETNGEFPAIFIINEKNNKTVKKIYRNKDGTITIHDLEHAISVTFDNRDICYQEGVELYESYSDTEPEEIKSAKKAYYYSKNNLKRYDEDIEITTDNIRNIKKCLNIKDNSLVRYTEDFDIYSDDNFGCEKCIYIKNNQPTRYIENAIRYPDGSANYEKRIVLTKQGTISHYDYEVYINDKHEYQKCLFFKDNKPYLYGENIEKSKDKNVNCQNLLYFDNNTPTLIIENMTMSETDDIRGRHCIGQFTQNTSEIIKRKLLLL